jgi:hypothetical protein
MMAQAGGGGGGGGGAGGCCKMTGWAGKERDKFCGVCGTKNPSFMG